jgi:predicted transcriptional regulator of viral defense system
MGNLKTLGRVSAHLISKLYEESKSIFEISDVRRISNKNHNEATDLLSELVQRRIITRLKAGKFLIIPQEIGIAKKYIGNWFVAAREVVNSPDYYVAFFSAMHYWGMLTQPLIKIFIATPKRQIVPRELKDKLIFVFLKEKHTWGIIEEWVTKTEKIRISNLEKTLVDSLAHPRYCGGITEVAKGIWIVKDKINYDRLGDYVDKYNKNVIAKRLGYILDILKIKESTLILKLKKYVRNRYDLFDPTLPEKRVDKNDWRLIDNIGQEQILDLVWH